MDAAFVERGAGSSPKTDFTLPLAGGFGHGGNAILGRASSQCKCIGRGMLELLSGPTGRLSLKGESNVEAASASGSGTTSARATRLRIAATLVALWLAPIGQLLADRDAVVPVDRVGATAATFTREPGLDGVFTWWLPDGADRLVLPMTGGVIADRDDASMQQWLRRGSPWSLVGLPLVGARYGNRQLTLIVPHPHYSELVVEDRVGIRFRLPPDRLTAAPCTIVALWTDENPLSIARAFRHWRRTSEDIGAIPRSRPLSHKARDLPRVKTLYGAPHIYLWGPALFSKHDVPRAKWIRFARALREAPPNAAGARIRARMTADELTALNTLCDAEWPMAYLTTTVAGAVNRTLADPQLVSGPDVDQATTVRRNREAVAIAFKQFTRDPTSWGDGNSITLLDGIHEAGIENAFLLTNDLHADSPRPDVADRATKYGYSIGPYDSYHSVHSPRAAADETWETAQFDLTAFKNGRVLNADGSGHGGFKNRGFHFSPQAAWPYVQNRVNANLRQAGHTAWFIDCDATAECFDDYHPAHPATRPDDTTHRRERLKWLENAHRLIVASEGGSVLFSDVIHVGHGVHTPYIGHLDPQFRDRTSPHFLGRHWPPDTPEQSFKPVPIPNSLRRPYFDPTVRVPLYQAVLGDEVIATHHWSFDSLKLSDVRTTRSLLEILYMVPPMYHLNRESWPKRQSAIRHHVGFWSQIHRTVVESRLSKFEWLSDDRLLQRTTFETSAGDVTITVNFDSDPRSGFPGESATVAGAINIPQTQYVATQ